MNAIVRRYSMGRPVSERLAMMSLWNRLEEQFRDERQERLFGRLPTYGRTAMAFIREMRERGIDASQRWAASDGRRPSYTPSDASRRDYRTEGS